MLYVKTRAEWLRWFINPSDKILDLGAGDLFCYQVVPDLAPHTIVDKNYHWLDGELFWRRNEENIKIPEIYKDALALDISTVPLPFQDDSFDVVVAAEVFEHIDDPRPVISEALRVAHKLVGTVPDEDSGSDFPVLAIYSKRDLLQVLGYSWHLVNVQELAARYWSGYGFIVWK